MLILYKALLMKHYNDLRIENVTRKLNAYERTRKGLN
jgi:hypothetical protein